MINQFALAVVSVPLTCLFGQMFRPVPTLLKESAIALKPLPILRYNRYDFVAGTLLLCCHCNFLIFFEGGCICGNNVFGTLETADYFDICLGNNPGLKHAAC
jgi:hypothetical protein